jgi:cytochrome c-type biogenesis protein CcmE
MGNNSRRDGLDDELAEAAGLDADEGQADGAMAVPEPAEPRVPDARNTPKKGSWGLLVTLLVMAAGLVALFMFGFKDAAVYSVPVDKLLADQGSVNKRVRIDGELVPGTLARRDQPCEYRFRVRAEGKELEIRYPQCVIPDTFRDVPQGGVMVTAEGKLLSAGHFEASLILAKCSSKYDPKTHQMDAPAASASPDAI